eukprot:SAG31_NODE_4636_length_3080_cov_2.158672_1_plen_138_part_00
MRLSSPHRAEVVIAYKLCFAGLRVLGCSTRSEPSVEGVAASRTIPETNPLRVKTLNPPSFDFRQCKLMLIEPPLKSVAGRKRHCSRDTPVAMAAACAGGGVDEDTVDDGNIRTRTVSIAGAGVTENWSKNVVGGAAS